MPMTYLQIEGNRWTPQGTDARPFVALEKVAGSRLLTDT